MKKIILLIIEKIRKALKVDEKGNSFGWGKGTLLLTALMMVGCDELPNKTNQEKIDEIYAEKTFIVDSCEYISFWKSATHKGNCRFCKERRQKELEVLVTKLKEK